MFIVLCNKETTPCAYFERALERGRPFVQCRVTFHPSLLDSYNKVCRAYSQHPVRAYAVSMSCRGKSKASSYVIFPPLKGMRCACIFFNALVHYAMCELHRCAVHDLQMHHVSKLFHNMERLCAAEVVFCRGYTRAVPDLLGSLLLLL